MGRRGFTLIELVMIIVILGILAVVAIPKYIDLQTKAKESAEKGVVGGVRSGISTYMAANNGSYPTALDSAADGSCTVANPCFVNVLAQGGITDSTWTKAGNNYTGTNSTIYRYNSTDGSFR